MKDDEKKEERNPESHWTTAEHRGTIEVLTKLINRSGRPMRIGQGMGSWWLPVFDCLISKMTRSYSGGDSRRSSS
ncbi:hypothetical protein EAG_13344 [Camponotus floridanus]|uniref:Uncharacterized protein n=1 Tax=Camponotus floridanus TaxID=104421 RepID=E2A5P0_CAMFO|nr:hypothetical protein EAG_13344 [Camponotus floridanus]